MSKQTAANNLLLKTAKRMFNGKIYRRISDLVNQGKPTYEVIDWILMQYKPDVRQARKQEWCQMLGLTAYADAAPQAGESASMEAPIESVVKAINAGLQEVARITIERLDNIKAQHASQPLVCWNCDGHKVIGERDYALACDVCNGTGVIPDDAPPAGETWKSVCADAHNDAMAQMAQLQAANERIAALEADNKRLQALFDACISEANDTSVEHVMALEQQIEALEADKRVLVEAVEFYANKRNWIAPLEPEEAISLISGDCGDKARQALVAAKGEQL